MGLPEWSTFKVLQLKGKLQEPMLNFNLLSFNNIAIILCYKTNCDGNYCGTAVSNTMVIYRGISSLEMTGIFITLAVNYHDI
jgi:hypothetical protein